MAKAQVLIVEDDGILATEVQGRLKKLGFSVSAIVPSGDEAIEKAKEDSPDLVLMDIKLKGEMDGIEAAGQIRTQFDIPVVYVTAHSDEKVLERAKKTAPFGYITKPFEDRELNTAIEIALYKHRIEKELRKSEERYRTLIDDVLDSSAVGIFILDSKFRVVWVNRALEHHFGLKRDEIVGKDKRQLICERIRNIFEDPETFVQKVLATYDNNTYVENFECHVLADGMRQERWLQHWSQPIRSGLYAGGRIEHYTDITERKRVEEALRKRETDLEAKSHHLKEVNTALKVLLKQREEDKKELEENVLSNVKQLISPHLQRLKKSRLDADQKTFINIVESNLDNIVSPLVSKLSSKIASLTPAEIRIADLVKEGKTNKEMAEVFCLSTNTILFHRFNIRSKLGLKNKKINLRSHLLSLIA